MTLRFIIALILIGQMSEPIAKTSPFPKKRPSQKQQKKTPNLTKLDSRLSGFLKANGGSFHAQTLIGAKDIGKAAIVATKIAANSISSQHITNNAITTAKIKNGAVTAEKIADQSITPNKFAGPIPNSLIDPITASGKVANSATSATNLSIPRTIVSRDANNNFEAGTIKANLDGNVVGAVIGNLTGNLTGSVTGNLQGTVTGDLTGNVVGNVRGNVTGDVTGNLHGNATGNVKGNVIGDLTGNVHGNVAGNLTGNVKGNLSGNVTGDVTGNLTGNVTSNAITAKTITSAVGAFGDISATGATTLNRNLNGFVVATAGVLASQALVQTENLANQVITTDKIANQAITPQKTTACAINTPCSLVVRDDQGNFAANIISAKINGDVVGNVAGNIQGNVKGNLSGNVTGDVTGNLAGNVTSNAITAKTITSAAGTFGDISATGTTALNPKLNGFIVASAGVLSSEALVQTANLANQAITADKIADQAITPQKTTACAINTPCSLVVRDDQGNFAANIISAKINGDVVGNVAGNIQGNVKGNLSGNVTGDVTGNLAGNVTSNAITAKTINSSVGNFGDISVTGTAYGPFVPVGSVLPFAALKAPNGYLLCDGSAISRTEYAALWTAIGTTYGAGDGANTFNIPNVCSVAIMGLKQTDQDFDTLGKTGGSKRVLIATQHLPRHTHEIIDPGHNHPVIDAGHAHGFSTYKPATGGGKGSLPNASGTTAASISNSSAAGITVAANTAGITCAYTGGGTALPCLPPYIVMNYIIKY